MAKMGRPERIGVRKLHIWIDENIAKKLDEYVNSPPPSIGKITKTSVIEYALKKFFEEEEKRG